MPDPDRARGVDILTFTSSRRAAAAAVRAGRRIMPMRGLVDVDVDVDVDGSLGVGA